jgi:phage tail sheath protein FI
MAQTLATPGVYIEERNAFPNSVAAIPTAVPAFVGYTEKTTKDGESLINKPVRITSLGEFHATFGAGFSSSFVLKEAGNPAAGYDLAIGDKFYVFAPEKKSRFIFYDSIRLFFANGGSTCYIVSAGAYTSASDEKPAKPAAGKDAKPEPASGGGNKVNEISKKALETGLNSLITVEEPTMVVIPEAVMLDEGDCFALQQDMILHCGFKMKNRFAILDVYDGFKARSYDKSDVITRFREGVGSNFLAFGAAYYPYVQTAIVQNEEVNFKNVTNSDLLVSVLSKEADLIFDNPKKAEEAKLEIKKIEKADNVESLNQTLKAISPAFKKSVQAMLKSLNLLPPSAAMAGLYSMVDNSRGVWKAPANISIGSVIAPAINMTNDDQEDLNVTVTGKSVNAIRSFVGQGTLVWGARTLDGNSQDWKYINVRRTMIYIEQSIKYAAKSYVYEPNTANTWVLVKSMISSFLNTVWKLGGLAGVTPSDAYEVEVGLGTTMTPNDILDGIMKITVKVAVTRPAEFIVITFEQKMQQS